MKELEKLKENIKRMSTKQVPVQTFWATVLAVDWDKKTADVKDLSADLEVYDVLLGFGKDVFRPTIGTNCLCGIVGNKDAAAFIIYVEEVEERWINGDENGGMVVAGKLIQQLNKMTARIDGIIDAINNGVAVPQDGGVGLQNSIKTSLAALINKEEFSDIQNNKVKHGE